MQLPSRARSPQRRVAQHNAGRRSESDPLWPALKKRREAEPRHVAVCEYHEALLRLERRDANGALAHVQRGQRALERAAEPEPELTARLASAEGFARAANGDFAAAQRAWTAGYEAVRAPSACGRRRAAAQRAAARDRRPICTTAR